jgi:hypothetical protein
MRRYGFRPHAGRSRSARLACAVAGLTGLALAGLPVLSCSPVLAGSPAALASSSRPVPQVQRLADAPVPGVPASARFVGTPRAFPATPGVSQACDTPSRPGQMACMALVRTNHVAGQDASSPSGYTPADLLDAYGLTSAAAKPGNGERVAVVDAYNDPHAASDLALYRQKFGLPACTTPSGCLTIANQTGTTTLPKADPTGGGWTLEESLDLDMVSAICPNCQILLIEANSDNISDLARAEATASRAPGVNAVTNSWGSGTEFIGETQFDPDFYAPGVAIAAAAGDGGYGTQYPAVSPYVTAVGGTSLTGTLGGTWSQAAWSLTGSGCSALEPKPSWQTGDDTTPGGCLNRTANDVSALADPSTGVAVYDTEKYAPDGGAPDWAVAGGTSVATPIIASTYALADIAAGGPGKANVPGSMPAAYPYLAASGLTDVTGGSDGSCEADRKYLCSAVKGFDGPTGLGTPAGTAAFTGPANGGVTIIDPGPQVVQPGAKIYLVLDTLPGTETPSFTMTPAAVGSVVVDKSGIVQGMAPTTPGIYHVKVSATITNVGSGSTSFSIVVLPKVRAHPAAEEVRLGGGRLCLTDPGKSARAGTAVRLQTCAGQAGQRWEFVPGSVFSGAGTMRVGGKCLAVAKGSANGAGATIQACSSSAREQWSVASGDRFRNAGIARCLDIQGQLTAGKQAVAWNCDSGAHTTWTLPTPVYSGVPGMCLTDPRASGATGTRIEAGTCGSGAAQRWIANKNGTLEIAGICLAVTGASLLSGAGIQLARCTGKPSQQWLQGPSDELVNANSSRCLADPGNSHANGAKLVQDDCYVLPGEIWTIS